MKNNRANPLTLSVLTLVKMYRMGKSGNLAQ